jgi:AraC-like DNA-binding protein
MQVLCFIPTGQLRPYIKAFTIIECNDERQNAILPDTCIVMALRLRGKVIVPGHSNAILPLSTISGIRKNNRLIHYSKNAANLLIHFKEGAAAAFFKTPLHELANTNTSLDLLLPHSSVNELEQRLAEADNYKQQIVIVEEFLLSLLKPFTTDKIVSYAIKTIHEATGTLNVTELAKSLFVSQDVFEKRFRRIVGTTPKQYSKIVRMQHAIKTYNSSKKLTGLAYSGGYFDQSHFIKDFKAFTGQTPHQFFQLERSW